MYFKEKFEEEAKNNFKNHKAVYVEYSSNLAVLDWRNKSGSSIHYIRYVFDGNNLYISGDVGAAVVYLTEKATLSTLADYLDRVYYFAEKIQCSTDLYMYDYATARKVLEKHLIDSLDDGEYDNPDDKQTALEERYDLISDLYDCLDQYSGWTVGSDLIERLSEIDSDMLNGYIPPEESFIRASHTGFGDSIWHTIRSKTRKICHERRPRHIQIRMEPFS